MKRVLRFLFPVLVIGAGVGGAFMLLQMRPQAKRQAGEAQEKASRVEFTTAHAEQRTVLVTASGTVSASRQVLLSSQVSGKVTWASPELVEGGLLRKGEPLLHVDDRDYRIAMEREQSRVEQLALELQLEETRGQIAEEEWKLLGNGRSETESPLALRKPQLENAKRQHQAAQLAVRQAALQLERTRIATPFDAMVMAENVEIGQVVAPGAQIATLIGTDRFWVKVSVPVAKLQWLKLRDGNQPGSTAHVFQNVSSDQRIHRTGEVLRIAGPLDPKTRTANVIVEIAKPLEGHPVPLLPGAFVDVEIEGQAADSMFVLPREALYEGGRVWLIDGSNRLQPKNVDIAWSTADQVFVREGLEEGDRILTTALSTPIAGMEVAPQAGPSQRPPEDSGQVGNPASMPKLETR